MKKDVIVTKGNFYFEDVDETIRCVGCNRPIKKKIVKATKGKVTECYCCGNISKGVTKVTRHKWDIKTQSFVKKKDIDFFKLRENNRREYGWYGLSKNRSKIA